MLVRHFQDNLAQEQQDQHAQLRDLHSSITGLLQQIQQQQLASIDNHFQAIQADFLAYSQQLQTNSHMFTKFKADIEQCYDVIVQTLDPL